MIFVTVGTHYLGFERLIKEMDDVASKIDEKVVAQIGSTKYKPKNMSYFTFVEDEKRIVDLYKKARVVISHAGAGSILRALSHQKPLIVVPRLKKFNEHIDDHQLELAEVLKKEGKAVVVYDVKDVEKALKEIKKLKHKKNIKNNRLIIFLKKYIEEMKNEDLHGNINSDSS